MRGTKSRRSASPRPCGAQAQAQAQETETDPKEALQQLLSKALSVTISARVLPPDTQEETPIWNAESTKLTIPGRLHQGQAGRRQRPHLPHLHAYLQEDGEVLLLAQGQVWLTQPTDKEAKYYSTFYSIPVSFGEKVLFFPLGLAPAEGPAEGFLQHRAGDQDRPLRAKAIGDPRWHDPTRPMTREERPAARIRGPGKAPDGRAGQAAPAAAQEQGLHPHRGGDRPGGRSSCSARAWREALPAWNPSPRPGASPATS